MKLGLAFRTFFRVLSDAGFAGAVESLFAPARTDDSEAKDRQRQSEQVRLLGLLQRDGRLIDFLSENLADYSDEQVGAAVRDIHRDTNQALAKYVELAPILDQDEDSPITIPEGFDPLRIRLVGQVTGSAPHKGVLVHRGWQAKSVSLPATTGTTDSLVLAPAEVEIS